MRRILLVLATMLAAVLMASGLALAAKPFSNATTITINDGTFSPEVGDIPGKATPYPSVIDVSGLSGTIEDVNLKLRGYSHPFPDDVDVLLVGPSGANAIVMSDVGSSFDVRGKTLVLDDEAKNPLPNSSALRTGRFQPANYASPENESFPSPAPPRAESRPSRSSTAPIPTAPGNSTS